ncbi:MAG: hypothetical protein ACJAZ9_001089 [Neolewinella sp.]|jgi:hypothetical protein
MRPAVAIVIGVHRPKVVDFCLRRLGLRAKDGMETLAEFLSLLPGKKWDGCGGGKFGRGFSSL